jgi:hypothetical protein
MAFGENLTARMDITQVPFNKFVRITRQEGEPGFLLQLGDSPDYQNHLGTVHASAQLALAEATSGECLMRKFPELGKSVLAVVRRLEAKFRNPLKGKIMSRARIPKENVEKMAEQLQTKGRGLISVEVEVVAADGAVGLIGTVEWFVQKQKPSSVD